MKLVYGAYEHAENSVQFTYQRNQILSPLNRRIGYKIRVDIRGALFTEPSQSAVTTAIEQLEQAYLQNGQDLIFYDDSGNPTPHTIISNNTLNGTRVIAGPTWAPGWEGVWGPGLEYFNRRTFRISIEAESPASEFSGLVSFPEDDLVSYTETTVILANGESDFVIQEALAGPPQRQDTVQQTLQRARQFGTAIGYAQYPSLPQPIWPTSARKPRPLQEGYRDPQQRGANMNTHWPIYWDWLFEATDGLNPTPPSIPA
jgi:hypothetical protein